MIAPAVERRGHLWTAAQAADQLGLDPNTVHVWRNRGLIEPAVPSRPALYWSDDLYDTQARTRLARRTTAV